MSVSKKEVSLKTHERVLCKLDKKGEELKILRAEHRKLKKENKRLRSSCAAWREKAKQEEVSLEF